MKEYTPLERSLPLQKQCRVDWLENRLLFAFSETLTSSGSNAYTNFSLGNSSGNYDLLYQTGGSSTVSGTNTIGATKGGRGELVVKGGNFIANSSLAVGGSGYGGMSVGGGQVSIPGNLYIANNSGTVGTSGSYYTQVGGATQVGKTFIGSPNGSGSAGTLVINGGSYSTGGYDLAGTGSTLVLGGPATGNPVGTTGAINESGATGADFSNGTTLVFEPSDSSVPILNLGTGELDFENGAKFQLDLSNYHYTTTSTQTFTLATFGTEVGQSLAAVTSSTVPIGASGFSVSYSLSSSAIKVTITHSSTITQAVEASQAINQKPGVNYQYEPSLMYDQSEGVYKVWDVYNAVGAMSPNNTDNIAIKEYPTYLGLTTAPEAYAFSPDGNDSQVNGGLVADPSVYRDAATNTYYMAYTGNTSGTANVGSGQVGMAKSANGGRTFTAYYLNYTPAYPNGELVAPDGGSNAAAGDYGVGQPSVVQVGSECFFILF